ncbi:MAG: permease [Burkholderiales bacterium PBB6]|nr:MAG: permease [Burkholderiales bacterium PBB6]
MEQILALTLPVYLLLGVGWLAVRGGLFNAADMRVMGKFVVNFSLPALLFHALASRSISEMLNLRFLAAFTLGSLAAMALSGLWAWRGRKRLPVLAVLQGWGSAHSNTGFFGFAIAAPLIGPPAAVAFALALMVENMVMLPLGLALSDAAHSREGGSQSFNRAFRNAVFGLRRNPMVLAIFAGAICAVFGLHLPASLTKAIELVATTASPTALVVIGGTLAGFSLSGMWGDISNVAAAKLLLHPLMVGLAMWALGPLDVALVSAAIVFAASPMMSIYPVIAQKYGHEGLAAATLVVTTLTSFVTMNAVLWLLPHVVG